MISHVLEWYRIVDVQPAHETVIRRRAAASALVTTFTEASDWEVLAGTAAGVVAGFDNGHAADAPHVTQLISALRAEDPTVPQDLSENALEVRTMAAVVLGELMARNPGKPADDTAVMVAMLLQSGIGLRSRPNGKHVAKVLDGLAALAQRVLSGSQQQRRRRSVLTIVDNIPTLTEAQGDAIPHLKTLATAVRAAMKEFRQQAAIDREELDILWWLYGATSTTTGSPLAELASGLAAITCGVDVANLCLLPPLLNADAFVREAMGKAKKSNSKQLFEKIMAETDSSVWSLLLAEEVKNLGSNYPTLFPLSWLCARLTSSNGAPGWAAEFRDKTGIDPAQPLHSVDVAAQAFRERIAQRQFTSAD